jgi:hypothetical protein
MLAVKLLSLFYLMSLRAISYELSCIPTFKPDLKFGRLP